MIENEAIRQLDRLYGQLSELAAEYSAICSASDSFDDIDPSVGEDDSELRSIEDAIKAVSAVLKVASAHTSDRTPHEQCFLYDRSKLATLQVQIDPYSRDDEKAAELFYEAYGQLNGLNKKLSERHAALKGAQDRLRAERRAASHAKAARLKDVIDEYNRLLETQEFTEFLHSLSAPIDAANKALLGCAQMRLPLPSVDGTAFASSVRIPDLMAFNAASLAVELPIILDLARGTCILFGQSSDEDRSGLGDSIGFILNALGALVALDSIPNVSYVDPITHSPVALGPLAVLSTGGNPVVSSVPRTPEEMRAFFTSLGVRMIQFDNRSLHDDSGALVSDIFIFRDYPCGYDAPSLSLIRKLALMAREYGILVMLEESRDLQGRSQAEAIDDVARRCVRIGELNGEADIVMLQGEPMPFQWAPITEASEGLLSDLVDRSNRVVNEENSYVQRIGKELSKSISKGDRTLTDLPIGLSDQGDIVKVAFEDENFATFICGAARSGKSTLLHTLLTSVFMSKHPDDVEVWLVDFKMTEFSRYIADPPPHIRYIVLDESPELVYDLLDRLTDVLAKRQALFKKNGWVKLSDAQSAGRYMPALFIVIDEFSVMSKIIADAAMEGKDYKDKLQMLLAKGAALGFRFIFASQGFTQGTRGLNEFSKKQIQQRIAMKTDYAEIRETLDLPSVNEDDRRLMEGLVPHYALLNTADSEAHISRAHILYFSDADEQKSLLSPVLAPYTSAAVYDPETFESYISKKIQVFDGNELTDYASVDSVIENAVSELQGRSYDPTIVLACVGQPTRMKDCVPIELVRGFAENLLFIVPMAKGEAFQSTVATIAKSLRSQGIRLNVIVPRSTPLMPSQLIEAIPNLSAYFGSAGIEAFVEERRDLRVGDDASPMLTIILNPEIILEGEPASEGACFFRAPVAARRKVSPPSPTRKEGEDDLATRMRKGVLEVDVEVGVALLSEPWNAADSQETFAGDPEAALRRCNVLLGISSEEDASQVHGASGRSADPGLALLEMLESGSKHDDHFMLVTSNAKELKKLGISVDWFRHRLAFRMAREDARELMSRSDASIVIGLMSDSFRYANGLDGVTFRPYSHADLNILSEDLVDVVDEYLL